VGKCGVWVALVDTSGFQGLNVEEVTALEAADMKDAAEDVMEDAPLLVLMMTECGAVIVNVA